MVFFSILLGKLTAFFIQLVLNRNASTWPGHLVLGLDPKFIKNIFDKNPEVKIVLIAGTNGKTTTTKALDHILNANKIPVIRNDSGANLLNGLASLLIKRASIMGKINQKALLFEVDENSLPLVLSQLSTLNSQLSIVLLNLFRDQLDRYGEINTTAEKWSKALSKLPEKTTIISNADDPLISFISKTARGRKYYYSIADSLKREKELSHAVDSTTCPKCFSDLEFTKIAYSHLGNYKCKNCGLSNPKAFRIFFRTGLMGIFNIYNLSASILAAKIIFKINEESSLRALTNFKPAFGRQEEIEINDKKAIILLSKNPTGFNESLKVALMNKYSNFLLVLNDRIPDGRDISWIWDVDFEMLAKHKAKITVTGDRTYDLANRLQYTDITGIQVDEDLNSALKSAFKQTPIDKTLAILPTYSAMLEVRKILTGKSIL